MVSSDVPNKSVTTIVRIQNQFEKKIEKDVKSKTRTFFNLFSFAQEATYHRMKYYFLEQDFQSYLRYPIHISGFRLAVGSDCARCAPSSFKLFTVKYSLHSLFSNWKFSASNQVNIERKKKSILYCSRICSGRQLKFDASFDVSILCKYQHNSIKIGFNSIFSVICLYFFSFILQTISVRFSPIFISFD